MAAQDASYQISTSAAQRIEVALLDLRELVIAGFATMNDRFDRLEARVDRLEVLQVETNARLNNLEARMTRQEEIQHETNLQLNNLEAHMTEQESAQRETNVRLARIEGQNEALYNDIKALYHELAKLKRKHGPELAKNRELLARVRKVEVFAHEVSVQTGIPYEGA